MAADPGRPALLAAAASWPLARAAEALEAAAAAAGMSRRNPPGGSRDTELSPAGAADLGEVLAECAGGFDAEVEAVGGAFHELRPLPGPRGPALVRPGP